MAVGEALGAPLLHPVHLGVGPQGLPIRTLWDLMSSLPALSTAPCHRLIRLLGCLGSHKLINLLPELLPLLLLGVDGAAQPDLPDLSGHLPPDVSPHVHPLLEAHGPAGLHLHRLPRARAPARLSVPPGCQGPGPAPPPVPSS